MTRYVLHWRTSRPYSLSINVYSASDETMVRDLLTGILTIDPSASLLKEETRSVVVAP